MKKIILTGGGTAGHVTPNLALIEKFLAEKWEVSYVGSYHGIEKELIGKLEIPYYPITTGKLRRYFSWQNFIDPFKVLYGIFQALSLCFKIKPKIIFSKGGFVALPIVVAGWILRIPVIIHESDLTLGLSNRLCAPLATKVCVTFPDTIDQIKNKMKGVISGSPIRKDLLNGSAELGRQICGFMPDKKTILVFGGSLGAEQINKTVRELLPNILEKYQIAHICGKDKVDTSLQYPGYKQFEYLHDEFPHLIAAADLVISRSGANTIYELLVLRKPNILIPLTTNASRGDQLINAQYCAKWGYSEIIPSDQLSANFLMEKITLVDRQRKKFIAAIKNFEVLPAIEIIYNLAEKELSS